MLTDKTVLIVNRTIEGTAPLKSTLNGNCKKIYTATDSTEALTIFKERRPDIIISDYQITGMDGRQLFRELRKLDSGKIFVMISSIDEKEIRFDEANVTLYKPFSYDLILSALSKEVIRQYQL